MSIAPPAGSVRISPYLVYEDPEAAIEWLAMAFGTTTRVRIEDGDGRLVHCELEYAGGVIGIGAPTPEGRSPKGLGGRCTQSLHGFVDSDIDEHYARARSAGARVVRELVDMHYGDRTYGVADPEGHLWYFGYRYDPEAWDDSMQSQNKAGNP